MLAAQGDDAEGVADDTEGDDNGCEDFVHEQEGRRGAATRC